VALSLGVILTVLIGSVGLSWWRLRSHPAT